MKDRWQHFKLSLRKTLVSSLFKSRRSSASSQQDLHSMLEDLSLEVGALKNLLQYEIDMNKKLFLELEEVRNSDRVAMHLGVTDMNSNDSCGSDMLELHHKLEPVLRSNTELVAEKETLLGKLRDQQQYIGKLQQAKGYEQVDSWMSVLDRQQSDLLAELRAYREQHKGLAELVGSTGILQETLFRQKQELLQKLQIGVLENQITELKHQLEVKKQKEDKITELKKQLEVKQKNEDLLQQRLHDLENILEENQQQLTEKLDSLQLKYDKLQLAERIIHLEEQMQELQLHVEQFQSNSTAVRQMKAQFDQEQKIIDLEQEVSRLKQEEQLQRKLFSDLLPVLEKFKNINVMLDRQVIDIEELALTQSHLLEERQQLLSQVKELQEKLKTADKSQVQED